MSHQQNITDPISPDMAVTLDGLFRRRVSLSPDRPAYRYFSAANGDWRQYTWGQTAEYVGRWCAALQAEKLGAGERVALMLPNCCEWIQFEQAAMSLGLVVVPLYVNDRPDNIAYILNDTAARVLLINGDDEQWAALFEVLNDVRGLQRIISLRKIDANDARLQSFADWLPEVSSEIHIREASPDDLATIVYTSGTVGRPKGVMLSHRNILWNAWAGQRCVKGLGGDDLFLSFLPLSHMLERTAGYYIPMVVGAEVAFARSIPQLAEDLLSLKPTVLISVPRIYERIYARIQSQLESRSVLERRLLDAAIAVGWRHFQYRQGLAVWSPSVWFWPLLKGRVASKVMARLGGRIRVAICGGAPLSANISRFFIGLGLPLLQGYGMTETAPVLNVNRPENNDPTSVGPALEDVEEMISTSGELLARGPGNMLGYWNNEQATREVIDADGWLHTGDIARIDGGRVYITGRVKDIIVMSNGEKVSPADMELTIALDPIIEQIMIIGEGRPFLAALIVLSEASSDEGERPDADSLCRRVGERLYSFPGYAQVRRVAVIDDPWTVEDGLITPTLKLRRNRICERFQAQIADLYNGH
jgi:long-chain acyl-CoA synthetase